MPPRAHGPLAGSTDREGMISVPASAFRVVGLRCGACIGEVMERVRAIPGVTGVSMGFARAEASPLVLDSRSPLPLELVREALAKTGFRVFPATRREGRTLERAVPGHAGRPDTLGTRRDRRKAGR